MPCLRLLLLLGLSPWLVSAARPTHFAALTADLGPAGRLGGRSERASRACPQEEPLLQVLLGLGVEDDELSDLHAVEGVVWNDCDVLEIDFQDSELHGSLSRAFLELPSLQKLILTGTGVSGHLAVLANSSELVDLQLRDLDVAGDLKELERAAKIKTLDLCGTKTMGNLKALEKAVDLVALLLSQAQVAGDLETLQNAVELKSLDLSDTEVAGDIKALQKATKLENLALAGTRISGSLKALKNASGLIQLDLSEIEITGDVKALESATKLENLYLPSTNIFGDLQALKNAKALIELDLSETKITGDLKALENATELENLYLAETDISGDMASLPYAKHLQDMDISGSEIQGTKCSHEEQKARQLLSDLGLNSTEATNLYNNDGLVWMDCDLVQINFQELPGLQGFLSPLFSELPNLGFLDLRHTEVSGDLGALSGCKRLQRLELSGSKISGNLEALENATSLTILLLAHMEVHGDLKALQNVDSLVDLDLRHTKVSGDLKRLERATGLRHVLLPRTKVGGDLKGLKMATTLHNLDLAHTSASGDLEGLPVQLVYVDLSHTNVLGDLKGLEGKVSFLQNLALSYTKLSGDLNSLENATELLTVDLSHTKVTGGFESLQRATKLRDLYLSHTLLTGNLNSLHAAALLRLDLSHTNVTGELEAVHRGLRARLSYLDVSATAVRGDVSDGSWALQTLKAAGCRLHGSIKGTSFRSLVTLDLSSTGISYMESIPRNCRTLLLSHVESMGFAPGLLRRAVEDNVFVDLRNATLANHSDAVDILNSGVVKRSGGRTNYNDQGFACYEVIGSSLQVSSEKFAPEGLCTCMPGWTGKGVDCAKCPADHFKENYSDVSNVCKPCPSGSQADNGSTLVSGCQCVIGKLYNNGSHWTCGCGQHEAFVNQEEGCVSCSTLWLHCPGKGSRVESAKPLDGFIRLEHQARAYRCLKPTERCTSDGNASNVCQSNYTGKMCMECADTFYAHGQRCEKCPQAPIPAAVLLPLLAGFAVACGLAAFGLWRWVGAEVHVPSRRNVLMKQLKAQAPLLLQMCQLWAVLAALASHTQADPEEQEGNKNKSTLWEIPYVQFLQLSITNMKGALSLQCRFDGAVVRFVSALAAPLLPLLVLLCCMVVEPMKPGLGITAALQALTLLYVGGASSTADLLSCHRKDGNRDPLPPGSEFRISMPYIPCGNATSTLKTQVDVVGYSAASAYIAVIPLCLLYLLLRLRTVLQASATTTWAAATVKDGLNVRVLDLVPGFPDSVDKKIMDREHVRRLNAAAAACIAVLYRGRVEVQIAEGAAMVKPLEDGSTGTSRDMLEGDLMDIFETENARAEKLKCRVIAEMLTERAVLEGALADDRALSEYLDGDRAEACGRGAGGHREQD